MAQVSQHRFSAGLAEYVVGRCPVRPCVLEPDRRKPATREMLFVLWDGGGLVVKRVEYVNPGTGAGAGDDAEAPALRLKSANPDYADYSCLTDEVHIVGKVLWTVRRV